jgi:hypothetical protein
MTAMATKTSLTFSGRNFINFQDRSYRWIASKRLEFAPAIASDEEILAALIEHREYRDQYASEDSHEHDSGTIHGPYLIERMSPASFEKLDARKASETVDSFCSLNAYLPPESIQERIISDVKAGFATADALYRLRNLPEATHEASFVLWEYREIAVICRSDSSLVLHVMAID